MHITLLPFKRWERAGHVGTGRGQEGWWNFWECDMHVMSLHGCCSAPRCRSRPRQPAEGLPLLGTALPRADSKWFGYRRFLETAKKTKIILFTKLGSI